jgi:glycosyltransferase involved in cell wall biosynthesis
MKLSIIVPAHNEEQNIADVVKGIESAVDIQHELIIVNDHSSDATAAIVEGLARDNERLTLVHTTGPRGFANALKTGVHAARGDYVVPVMADLCDELATVGAMYEKMQQGFDVVCASRYMRGGRRQGGSILKAFLSAFGGVSLRYIIGIPTQDVPNSFKMYRRELFSHIALESRGFEISMEIALKAHFLSSRITEVPTRWKERTQGVSSFCIPQALPAYARWYLWAIKKRITG